MKYKNKYYFLILFKWYIDKWNFGYPFFKKYQIFFDSDKKIFVLYPNKSNSNNWNFSPWILVFVFALLFIITLIILLIFIKYFKQKRKIRANELEDNFEYLPQYD
jgi:phosphotransferase system  glucose/maltose/N-acetylglucosamine-specific IIC component